ncbi:hypothetical protein CRG98_015298 [Punica granatum]|uniref:Uncharacterized protein n=1 Tax=Punica granatum TaxID=22663 RepID=A0A2I0K6X9_PUNGR|nr:hypothetical protein CRG98_015298 [Punica granatum]
MTEINVTVVEPTITALPFSPRDFDQSPRQKENRPPSQPSSSPATERRPPLFFLLCSTSLKIFFANLSVICLLVLVLCERVKPLTLPPKHSVHLRESGRILPGPYQFLLFLRGA